ncbi:MAG: hypothetical protein DWP95_10535 [Proteobacteria bacterium]|nr:MAG: hypothetical protein DWP95_10535 [Pseudomonadota bacterium]
MKFLISIVLIILTKLVHSNCIEIVTFDDVSEARSQYIIRQISLDGESTAVNKAYNTEVDSYHKCKNEKWRSTSDAQSYMNQLQYWNRKIDKIDTALQDIRLKLINAFKHTEEQRKPMQRLKKANQWYVMAYCDYEVNGKQFLDNKNKRNDLVEEITNIYREFSKGCYGKVDKDGLMKMFSVAGQLFGDWMNSVFE